MSDIVLEDTTAFEIGHALVRARRSAGSPAMGMVMTLIVLAPDEDCEDALAAATEAAREHPSRLLAVVVGSRRGRSRIDAEIRTGEKGAAGELALIRLSGPVADHADSVVLPLLLPDSPVIVWWPTDAPDAPAEHPVGRLATRRITDAAEIPRNRTRAMLTQCAHYAEGNTDLAWTRITLWRALLAAALDQSPGKVHEVEIAAQRVSPSADLLGAWLADRLKAPVTRRRVDGVGITGVRLATGHGDISITRDQDDPALATMRVPGQPDRPVALRRRPVPELLAEELRRLDADEVYEATVRALRRRQGSTASRGKAGAGTRKAARSASRTPRKAASS